MTDIYKAARERIAADFDKSFISAPRPSDTACLRERRKREWQRKARANYVAKNRDKIGAKARGILAQQAPRLQDSREYKHKEA